MLYALLRPAELQRRKTSFKLWLLGLSEWRYPQRSRGVSDKGTCARFFSGEATCTKPSFFSLMPGEDSRAEPSHQEKSFGRQACGCWLVAQQGEKLASHPPNPPLPAPPAAGLGAADAAVLSLAQAAGGPGSCPDSPPAGTLSRWVSGTRSPP